MKLRSLFLQHFRNYQSRKFAFTNETTLVAGPNASGKTNLLEAIYLLSLGESFRAQRIEEMISWNEEVGRVEGRLKIQNSKFKTDEAELQIILTRGEVQGKRVAKRKFLVNGVGKRRSDFTDIFAAVVFRPEDLRMVSGSPTLRRNWLDQVLVQVDREYGRSLLSYEQALRRRNKLLDLVRDEGVSRTQLHFWNQLLVRHGNVLTERRRELIELVNSGRGREVGESAYLAGKLKLKLDYLASTVSEKRLAQYAKEEVMAGFTLVGPHKDDFIVLANKEQRAEGSNGRDLAIYGSRGEQRLTVLWLKVMELEFIAEKKGVRPVLLLDDIFSELDRERLKQVLALLDKQQTIVTTTDTGLIPEKYRRKMGLMRLEMVR